MRRAHPEPTSIETTEASTGPSLEVDLTIGATVNEDRTVSVTAESNVPDGTELGASVSQRGGFTAQDSAALRNGEAASGPFSDKGNPVAPGAYDVSVTMPIARNQPDEVRAVMGDGGQNLTGPLVGEESITGVAVVSISDQLVVP